MSAREDTEPVKANLPSPKSLGKGAVGSGSAKSNESKATAHEVCQQPPLRLPLVS